MEMSALHSSIFPSMGYDNFFKNDSSDLVSGKLSHCNLLSVNGPQDFSSCQILALSLNFTQTDEAQGKEATCSRAAWSP